MQAGSLGVAAAIGAAACYMCIKKKASCAPCDALDDIKAQWATVRKTAGGRVDRAAFKEHCLSTHASKLTAASRKSFEEFLDKAFDAAVGLMTKPGAPLKTDLGRHCFSYAYLFAGEFYFHQAAGDQAASCGCGTGVADALELTK